MEKDYVQLMPREIREGFWPRAKFLSREEQVRYEEAVKGFNSEKARKSLSIPQDGSSLLKEVLLGQLGIRTATISELYDVWEVNPNFLSGHYEDVASGVLRSNGDSHAPNDLLAKSLAKSLKEKAFKHSYVLTGLKLKEEDNSQYGLVLVPKENFSYFEAPELDHVNNQKKFLRVDEREIPILLSDAELSQLSDQDKNKLRTLYTREGGLSRLCVDWDSFLDSNLRSLSYSCSYGRVVVVDAEGVAPNLESCVANLNQEREKLIAGINARYKTAKAILQGRN